ncbi:MAG: dihydropteroate synthase [Prevotellaceae bacterium]|nr:dihydropteroate synthase [Prevotellaceae bacterium]
MLKPLPYTININGRLLDLSEPQVMGILNVTPDSFYEGSRKQTDKEIRERADEILSEGASIIDIGAQSTRPGARDIGEDEETARLERALSIVREYHPDAVISVDTFRSGVARRCVEQYGVGIVNDISGGDFDPEMFPTVAELGVPYILMHIKGQPDTMQDAPHYENLVQEVMLYFSERIARLRRLGVRDIILDPGFGFGKTLEDNYCLMRHLPLLRAFELPTLVGVSRKSMVFRLLGGSPKDALNGTTALNTIALTLGANILRVHDVRACLEAVKITKACFPSD